MDSMRRENEKVPAIGNMSVNARGDQIKGGQVTKTADEIAREKGRVQSVLLNTGLKGSMPATVETPVVEYAKSAPKAVKPTTQSPKKTKEVELPSGDIVIEEGDDSGTQSA
jgi:hypothetical protein